MQCACGGETRVRSTKRKSLVLEYEACASCGRQGGYSLEMDGEHICSGNEARSRFLEMTEGVLISE